MASIIKNRKEARGGARINAGAKPKYNEPTETVSFRCPSSKVQELKNIIKSKLAEWELAKEENTGI